MLGKQLLNWLEVIEAILNMFYEVLESCITFNDE